MIKIKVPATSANLGPGFDVLGLALDLYNTFVFEKTEKAMGRDTLVHEAYLKVFSYLEIDPIPVEIKIQGEIPMSRGLGSSSACIVGGLLGANELLGNPLPLEKILLLATELEGHPDNVAPALLGGLVASVETKGKIYTKKIPVKHPYQLMTLIPEFPLSTEKARSVLPKVLSYEAGVHNVGRAILLTAALLTGEDDSLALGMEDQMHEPFRGELIEGFQEVKTSVGKLGALATCLSGAGPTILAIVKEEDEETVERIKEYMKRSFPTWQVGVHHLEEKGARRIL